MTDKPRDAEREAFETALASKPDARFWNTADAMFWAWQARAALAQQEAQAEQPAEQVPVGYWDGEFSKDGCATLYEVPQVSAFGHQHRNVPLYPAPQPVIPPAQEKQS